MAQSLQHHLNELASGFDTIPSNRRYWMIRTQGGLYYSTFRINKFVALEHDQVEYATVVGIYNALKKDTRAVRVAIRDIIFDKSDNMNAGLIAGQMTRFLFEVNKGDIVIIPSENSNAISFGEVTSSAVFEATSEDISKTDCPYKFRKKVRWLNEVGREGLDPYLYRMLQAHQAINDIQGYAEIIERSISNFFITAGEANLVLDVEIKDNIPADQLFEMGYYLLQYTKRFAERNSLEVDLHNIDLKINLNSPGKIQFKGPSKGTLWLIALLVIGVNGGGLKIDALGLDLSTDGLLKKIIQYQNSAQDREIRDSLMHNMDSLKVKSPDDAIKVFQQFSDNKNLPK